jgi:hypothetical protein
MRLPSCEGGVQIISLNLFIYKMSKTLNETPTKKGLNGAGNIAKSSVQNDNTPIQRMVALNRAQKQEASNSVIQTFWRIDGNGKTQLGNARIEAYLGAIEGNPTIAVLVEGRSYNLLKIEYNTKGYFTNVRDFKTDRKVSPMLRCITAAVLENSAASTFFNVSCGSSAGLVKDWLYSANEISYYRKKDGNEDEKVEIPNNATPEERKELFALVAEKEGFNPTATAKAISAANLLKPHLERKGS